MVKHRKTGGRHRKTVENIEIQQKNREKRRKTGEKREKHRKTRESRGKQVKTQEKT